MKIIKILFLFFVFFIIQGCVPAAFVAGATTGGFVIADRRELNTMVEDKKITCKALLRLNSNPELKEFSHIAVTTFNRVVLLTGETETCSLRREAYEIVKSIPGIRRINNAIQIGTPASPADISQDAWITTKVKAAMLAEKGLHSTQIKVLTEDATVYLMGLVSHHQAEVAINVARQVDGVEKVVTLFEYFNEI